MLVSKPHSSLLPFFLFASCLSQKGEVVGICVSPGGSRRRRSGKEGETKSAFESDPLHLELPWVLSIRAIPHMLLPPEVESLLEGSSSIFKNLPKA